MGGQLTGAFSIGKAIQLQSYAKLFRAFTSADGDVVNRELENRQKTCHELALSASAALPYQLILAAQFTYNSRGIDMQKTISAIRYILYLFKKTFQTLSGPVLHSPCRSGRHLLIRQRKFGRMHFRAMSRKRSN